ncbi:hypothetical protein ACFL2Q_13795, partial [Thermodesulfobacteriota bacterium]
LSEDDLKYLVGSYYGWGGMANNQGVSAKEVLADISAGLTDEELKSKYGISDRGLDSLFKKMINAGLLTESEVKARSSLMAGDLELEFKDASPPPVTPTGSGDQRQGQPPGAQPPGTGYPPGAPGYPPGGPGYPGGGHPPGPHYPGGPSYPPGMEEQIRTWGRNAIIGIAGGFVVGVVGQIVANIGGAEESTAGLVIGLIIALIGSGLLIWGFYCLAKKKGYHGAFCLLAFVPCLPGLIILLLLPDKYKTPGGGGSNTAVIVIVVVVVLVVLIVVLGIILAIAVPYYISYKRTTCDRAAHADIVKLGAAIERYRSEWIDFNCPPEPLSEDDLKYLVGSYYGWGGTNGKCEVRIRIKDGEVFASSLQGSRPQGPDSRYIYRIDMKTGKDLPAKRGKAEGKTYGGPGSTCYSETMLKADCTRRAPPGQPCGSQK